MKLYLSLASALAVCTAALFATSCLQNEMEQPGMPEFITGISVSGQDVDFSEIDTKVSYTDRLVFSWDSGDRLGIFPIGGRQQLFPLSDISNGSTASFDGGAWALRSSYEYAAYYPYTNEKSDTEDLWIPVDYSCQKQIGNNSTANLGERSYMVAEPVSPNNAGAVNLQMKQVGGVVRVEATVPAGIDFCKATIYDNTADMIVGGSVELGRRHAEGEAFVPVIEHPVYGSTIAVDLEDVVTCETEDGGSNLVFYIWMAPQDLTGHDMTLGLEERGGSIYTLNSISTTNVEVAKGKKMVFGSVEAPEDVDYLCFTAVDGDVDLSLVSEHSRCWDMPELEYSIDGSSWSRFDGGAHLEAGESMYLRGDNATFSVDFEYFAHFVFDGAGKVAASGNIMTLLDKRGRRDFAGFCCFYHLFEDCTQLISAPRLPATELWLDCYNAMFSGCSALTVAPELPATNLQNYCYTWMFNGCSSLTSAPELPATTLAEGCYAYMFLNCTALTVAPELPATTLAPFCYQSIFQGCTGITQAPVLPATTLEYGCYQSMFQHCEGLVSAPELSAEILDVQCYWGMFIGCSSLTAAPELPARTLANDCYSSMFAGCSSLTSAPELPAMTLAGGCYYSMFRDCTNLTSAPGLPATQLAKSCYTSMFDGCSSLTSAPELPAENLVYDCYCNMFLGCTSLTDAPALPAMSLAEWCYNGMFGGCTSLTSAPALPATELAVSCYGSMFASCTSLTSAPELPATVLVDDCYGNMFRGCSNLNRVSAAFLVVPDDIDAFNVDYKWLEGVAPTGTFLKNPEATWTREEALIPAGWAILTGTGASGEDLDPEW